MIKLPTLYREQRYREQRRRTARLRWSGLLLLLLLGSAGAAETPAQQLNRLLSGIDTFQAGFTQLIRDRQGEILQQADGEVAARRPGQLR